MVSSVVRSWVPPQFAQELGVNNTIRGDISILATNMTVEFSIKPMAATKAATNSKKIQSNVKVASLRTSCNTCAKLLRARTDVEKRDHDDSL